jgi:PST family polysaccharide transporter
MPESGKSGAGWTLADEVNGRTAAPDPPVLRTRVFQNAAALLSGRAATLLISAGASVILARYLGNERFGQFGAIYAYLSLFAWLAAFGIAPLFTREAARHREQAGSLLLTGTAICAVLSVGATLIALTLAPLAGYRGWLHVLVLFAAFDILLLLPFRIPAIIFQVDLRQWYSTGINLFRQLLWLVLVGILALLNAPLLHVVLARLLTALVEAALNWQASRRFLPPTRVILFDKIKPFLAQSFPVAVSSLVLAVYMRIDQVMLHNLASDRVLGDYVAAVKAAELFEALPTAILFSVFPVLSTVAAQSERFQQYVSRIFRYLGVAACGICVAITVAARPLVAVVYGARYQAAAPLLTVLIWSEVAVFFGSVVLNVLLASGLQKFIVAPTAMGALANVLLNILLIPRYGAMGAAWATLVSYSLAWLVVPLAFSSTRALVLRGLGIVLPAAAWALGGAAAAWLTKTPVLVALPMGLVVYVFGVWSSKLFHRDDFVYAWEALRGTLPRAS